jgi:hypothetical protein
MLILIITLLLTILSWTLFYLNRNKVNPLSVGALISSMIFSLASLLMVLSFSPVHRNDISDYRTVKWQMTKIDKIHVNDIPTIQRAVRWNEDILDHKMNKDSIWIGIWYSREVADLEPIKMPEGDLK